MRLLSPDSPEGTPENPVATPPPAPETPPPAPAPAPEAPGIVARTSTDPTPRERELAAKLSELEDENQNLKRALYEPKPKAAARPRGALASVESEFWGKA